MNRQVALAAVVFSGGLLAQNRPVDWPSLGGDARRDGWERSDLRITRENVNSIRLVVKHKLENTASGPHALTPPVVIGNLISYRGFKELGFVAGSGGGLWSLDLDIDRIFWKKRIEQAMPKSRGGEGACPGGLTATPSLTPPVTFGGRTGPRATASAPTPRPGATPSPGAPPTPAAGGTNAAPVPRVGGTGFGASRPLFVVTSDGKMHQLNTSTGDDQFPPADFLPPGAKASSLAMHDSVLYTTTSGGCGGAPNAVWALDLHTAQAIAAKFVLGGGNVSGLSGLAIGNDGTVYVQTGPGPSDPAANRFSNTLVALNPGDLKLKSFFIDPGPASGSSPANSGATPVVFTYKEGDMVVSAGTDGRLYLHDAQQVGGGDHKTASFRTPPLTAEGGGAWGGISSWEDPDGVRWIAAPVWGHLNPELKLAAPNGDAPNGSVVAFKVEEQGGKTVMTPAWASRDLRSPVPPVVTSGVVFALSTTPKAVLYALDAATGKGLYTTGSEVSAPATLTGLSLANGRVFFTTQDNVLYGFGIYLER